MDGFAFLDAIRDRPALKAVPVVVLTAKDLTGEEKQMLAGRSAQVLAKGETSSHGLGEAIRRSIAPPKVDAEHAPTA
jgi:CheY-like chemotaxis protein